MRLWKHSSETIGRLGEMIDFHPVHPIHPIHSITNREELDNLILMERIFPQEHEAVHVKMGKGTIQQSLSEIGFYSAVLIQSKEKQSLYRNNVGVLVRTKVSQSFEGGVSAGFAVINSPLVVK